MEIKNVKEAEDYLEEVTKISNIDLCIASELNNWTFDEFYSNLDATQINRALDTLSKKIFHTDSSNFADKFKALHCLIFTKLYDGIFPRFKEEYSEQDQGFYQKCCLMANLNITAEQLGSNENYGIPLTAAIVELAILDKYKTPWDKLTCLCTTFDLIFAEMKAALVTIISQNSENENVIPIIDNSEILPILMVVLIKSKLVSFFSNFFYIKLFSSTSHFIDILNIFEKGVNAILKINPQDLNLIESKLIQAINPQEFIYMSMKQEESNKTLVSEANERLIYLITKSTDEEQ